jgi:group II intron reverse transcriptase/maturase
MGATIAPAELVEGRALTKRNTMKSTSVRTQGRVAGSFGLDGVRQKAEMDRKLKFTALLHHITATQLRESYYQLKKDAAPGVDEETWREYYVGHWDRIENLRTRVHSGSYRAQPSRRSYIVKEDGSQRPLGIAALEDKIVQQAVRSVLNQIYEVDFMNFSYGFREGRSQHDALDALYVGITSKKVNWILDADIKGFFDNIDHERLLEFMGQRIGDKRILRLIRKWLKTGYIEDGKRIRPEVGTPQGSVISPLLANIFLHYVLDVWAAWWRRSQLRGDMIIVRYADDFVIGFQYYEEAVKFLTALRQRVSSYGLTLHPKKTRLIEFGKYALANRKKRGKSKPETFDFLGFTHISSKDKNGNFFLRRKTIKKRLKRKIGEVKQELRERMHKNVDETVMWLASTVRGYTNYHGVPGNMDSTRVFHQQCERELYRTLRRRSEKARTLTWKDFRKIVKDKIPKPRLTQPFPNKRFWRQKLEVGAI